MEYEKVMKTRPHVVILGAGASCATIPNGDKNGRYIPAMNGFIEKLGLNSIFDNISLNTSSVNLEDIYMELDERSYSDDNFMQAKNKLKEAIYTYISQFELPDEPTVYDYLLLSLTSKDFIATFNWDPLLMQAYERCSRLTKNLPQLAFLHGNVAIGYCEKDYVLGRNGFSCRCGKLFTPIDLLYPVKDKDYISNPYIADEWKRLKSAMKVAYMITIFGYSAPKSDVAAIEMMKKAWGSVNDRDMEEIEIVDLRAEDDVKNSWADFIHTHHSSYCNDFLETTLGLCPRRSCEATFDRLMNVCWLKPNGFKMGMSFKDISNLLDPLLKDEETNHGKILINPYLDDFNGW